MSPLTGAALIFLGLLFLLAHPVLLGAAVLLAGAAIAVGLLIVISRFAVAAKDRHRLRVSGISAIDAMDGETFEERLALLFGDLGYRVRTTRRSGDFGADLVLERGGSPRTVVQAKCYAADRTVGVGAVQEAVAARQVYHAGAAMVVTNRTFTGPAKELARANRVTLWDRSALIAALLRAEGGPRRRDTTADGRVAPGEEG